MTIDAQSLATHISAFLAGLAACWAWLRHVLGYLAPLEADVLAKLSEIKAQIASRPATPPAPAPGTPPASSAASAVPGATPVTNPVTPPTIPANLSPELMAAIARHMQKVAAEAPKPAG